MGADAVPDVGEERAARAAVVSGAGPSVLLLHEGPAVAVEPPPGWRSMALAIARDGAQVVTG